MRDIEFSKISVSLEGALIKQFIGPKLYQKLVSSLLMKTDDTDDVGLRHG